MYTGKLVFSQVMEYLPLHVFHQCVSRYSGDFKVKEFTCLDQYLCMAFAQLTYRESLRDIEASGLSGLRSFVQHIPGICFLRDQSQVQPQVPTGLLTSSRQEYRTHLRSVSATYRLLPIQGLSGKAAPGKILRCRERQNTGVSHQQLQSACHDYCRVVPMPLAGGAILQVDQAKPENQDLLRHLRKRCQSSDLDSNFSLRAGCHHEETTQNQGQSLHNFTGLERNHL